MLGKSPRKSGKATTASPSPGISSKNISKIKQQTQRKYPKKSTTKVPKSTRRFSLASDSSLSSVSEDERNFHSVPVFDSSSDEEEKNVEMNAIMGPSSSSESDSEDEFSSEDDSDVDFVQLTKEKKARAIKAAKSRKNPRKSNKSTKYLKSQNQENDKKKSLETNGEDAAEVDFQFLFDNDGNETFKIGEKKEDSEDDEISRKEAIVEPEEEEDIGEEVPASQFKLMDSGYDSNVLSENNLLKNHLMMDVPKIKEDEINSDEDYEIDDDKLIQTLQNDNDDLELAMLDDDDDDDDNSEPGEELLDANEFDNLSFEGEEDIDDYDDLIETVEDDLDEDNYLLKEETNAITKDFDSPHATKLKITEEEEDEDEEGFLKYLSEDSILFNDDDNDDDNDDSKKLNSDMDDYELTFFNNPFKDQGSNITSSRRNSKLSRRKYSIHSDSRNEFHWPYLKKSENDNYDEDDDSSYYSSSNDSDDDDDEEELHLKIITELQMHSGDSTDEDTSLPKRVNKKSNGSKLVAKEVLSTSETAPPLLGKWKTSESNKPFGIIDGLSTRSLNPDSNLIAYSTNGGSLTVNKKARSASFSGHQKPKLGNEEPMLIDDLLNMSELEDENEAVNDFDNTGFILERKIPLSAFRNKGYVPILSDSMEQLKKYSMNNKRLITKLDLPDNKSVNGKHVKFDDNNSIKKKKRKEKKMNRLRRQSIVEAAKEGLRTTKGGLFSENTIADVELFLADADNGDEFNILFRGVI